MNKLKKICAVAMCAATIGTIAVMPASAATAPESSGRTVAYYLGDADGNGDITAHDALIIVLISQKNVNNSSVKAVIHDRTLKARIDVDGDGKITSNDAVKTLKESTKKTHKIVRISTITGKIL